MFLYKYNVKKQFDLIIYAYEMIEMRGSWMIGKHKEGLE